MAYETTIDMRFCDLDGLGHVNNAHLLSYVELCRTRWYEDRGLGRPFQGDLRFNLILARSEIDYLAQLKLGRHVRCRCQVQRIGTKSFDMLYEVFDQRGVLVARAKAVLVWFDYETQASAPLPAEVKQVLRRDIMQ